MAVRRLQMWAQDELRSGQFLAGLTAGVLLGVSEVVYAVSVGSLIFSGELSGYLSVGIGLALFTAAVVFFVISLGSSTPGVSGGTQDSSSVILALIAAALVSSTSASSAEETLATVLVAIAASSLLTGAVFLAIGAFRLGGFVRFVPYPVIGGFLAGTGWLLLQGSFSVMAGVPLTFANLPALLEPTQLVLWVPGVFVGVVLYLVERHARHTLAMLATLTGAVALVYIALLATGTSSSAAMAEGLLLGRAAEHATWAPPAFAKLAVADWPAVLGQAGNIATIVVLGAVSLVLNVSGIELTIRRDTNLNREFRVAGVANVLSGLGGGMVGYQALNLTTLSHRVGARGRLPGVVGGVLCILMLLAGAPLLSLFPTAIVGGLLFFMGAGFLIEWVIDGRRRFSTIDYAVVLLILAVIVLTNLLIGIGVGLVATIILFVINYSRVDVIQHELSGAETESNVERCQAHRRRLAELGRQIHVLELRGYIFFGTANALLERVRSRVAGPGDQVRFLVLDFRRVAGLDSSAVLSFTRCRQLVETRGGCLVLTQISDELRRQFELGGLFSGEARTQVAADLDRGLEWCEDRLLAEAQVSASDEPCTLREQLAEHGFSDSMTARLLGFLQPTEFGPGESLIRQGENADDLFFLETGQVSVYLERETGDPARLRKLQTGTVVGEIGLYASSTRTASVIADAPTTAYRLTRAALAEMGQADPELAAAFHELVAQLLSERLVDKDQSLEALLR